jgi:hypothetical protein
MRLVPVIIVCIAILTAPLLYLAGQALMPAMRGESGGGSIDSGARIEIEILRQQIEALQDQIAALESELRMLESQQFGAEGYDPLDQAAPPRHGPNQILDAYAQVVLIANRRNVNRGLTVASPRFLEEFIGRPRETLSDDCEPMTNPDLVEMLVVEDVGPIRVQMLKPAVESLRRVFERVRQTDQDLYDRINTAGSLCVRQIRGAVNRVSSHAFGLAVDLNIDGHLDTLGDGRTQLGLTILADFFHEEGWVWGAAFSREDSMHFEVSRELLERWREEGLI